MFAKDGHGGVSSLLLMVDFRGGPVWHLMNYWIMGTPLPLRGYYFDERPSCKTTAKFFFIYVAARNLSFGHFCWAVLEKQLF